MHVVEKFFFFRLYVYVYQVIELLCVVKKFSKKESC